MSKTLEAPVAGVEELAERLNRIELRLAELEAWKAAAVEVPASVRSAARDREATAAEAEIEPEDAAESGFDLALLGRTLIVLGGAFMLRAASDQEAIPVAAGVALGLVYAAAFAFFALREQVGRTSATFHGYASLLVAFPLIWEATKKFGIFGPWSAALALAAISALIVVLCWRRRLNGLAWGVTLFALVLAPMMMLFTVAAAPFIIYLLALGIVTLWMGYELDWHLLRWPVALELDIAVLAVGFLVATNRNGTMSPGMAMALGFGVFATYLLAFALRTIAKQRDIVPFEIVQAIGAFAACVGAAVWIAQSRDAGELPLSLAILALAAGSYALSFAFLSRRSSTINFSFSSSLALVLTVTAGSLVVHGVASSVLWSVLAVAACWFASRYSKTSLAFHAGVYLVAGFVASGLMMLGLHALFLPTPSPWPMPGVASLLVIAACALAALLRPIERSGSFEAWSWAKLVLLVEAGWGLATLAMCLVGLLAVEVARADAGSVAVIRTAVLSLLTIGAAWASRYARFSPGRWIASGMIVVLVMKLIWDDFRNGRASTLFISLAIVGVALIVAPRLGKRASPPVVGEVVAG
ncbi:MAG: hypothetical protein NDJ92_02505 [Thermoanaerobaculia bacterium]|nr:hypothetical protein [Thermoanaerobaculia bacterium]